MSHDDAWQERVRAGLRAPTDEAPAAEREVASNAIAQGTRRLAASSSARVATMAALLALAVCLCARRWSEAEATRTAEATLAHGAPWIP